MAISDILKFRRKRKEIKPPNKEKEVITVPSGGRSSIPNLESAYATIKKEVAFINPGFAYEYIPVMRKLFKSNSSFSLAAMNIMELANTGFTIEFDDSIKPEVARKYREHLNISYKRWGFGTAGIHGLVNKWILQCYIGGAISNEWVINKAMDGIAYNALVDPETVRTAWHSAKETYLYYQVPANKYKLIPKKTLDSTYVKLNQNTFRYYALATDQEAPIGVPPFMSSLDDLQSQLKMLRNIGYVSDQLGLMGFIELMMTKPTPADGENPDMYKIRLETFLTEAKESMALGLKDGIVSGYKDDHEITFNATAKDTAGAAEIFDINQRMVSNGLLTDPQFMAGVSSGSETMVNIVFTKMLSQLHNIQKLLSENIRYGSLLELRLKGFPVKDLNVNWAPSTITDKLKDAQAEEIIIRNCEILYAAGQIDQEDYAIKVGLDKAAQKERRVPVQDPNKIIGDAKKKEEREKEKDDSDRKVRDKKKPQPKRKDQKTKK